MELIEALENVFPESGDAIAELLRSSELFREIHDDYTQLLRELATRSESDSGRDQRVIDDIRASLTGLQDDIRQALNRYRETGGYP